MFLSWSTSLYFVLPGKKPRKSKAPVRRGAQHCYVKQQGHVPSPALLPVVEPNIPPSAAVFASPQEEQEAVEALASRNDAAARLLLRCLNNPLVRRWALCEWCVQLVESSSVSCRFDVLYLRRGALLFCRRSTSSPTVELSRELHAYEENRVLRPSLAHQQLF